ncbi:hypothetical protein BOX15_Mlig034309g1 [Macrostomum lignano]|uniref:RRM domain-containing protein n=2 Tax=Macrostomum lignano TaxID=282301 RepID=A0A267FI41_9PLAT|nr:hypothetical protein BOX15_Mlig034309g1 [Macrostomum lignano]
MRLYKCSMGQAARATNRRLAFSATTKAAATAAAPVGELGVAISGSSPPPDRPTATAAAAAAVVGKQPNPGNSNSSIMPQPDYLVALHLTTCGKQGEEIGTDEAPICLIAYLIHDVRHNKIIAVEQHLVKPQVNPGQTGSDNSEEDGLATISEECRSETGLSADSFHSASYLESVLEEMDKFLRNKGIHPESGGKTFTLVLEGQHPMRLVFHPETCSKKISLEQFPYFYSFFDLRKEFLKGRNSEPDTIVSLKDMLDSLEMQFDNSPDYGTRQCIAMSRVISRLLNDGHTFKEPEKVNQFYYPAIVRKTDTVDDESVVRARGLPWQATDADIHKFFRGLNISAGGIALVLSKVGRRNGEALIRFDSQEHRDIALKKHRHHMQQRYIEVYRATGRDFVAVAGADTKEGENFLAKLTEPTQSLVRMRGLPYTVSADEILDFFRKAECPVQFDSEGVLFVNHKDGRATGDAFVIFENEILAERALQNHRQHIGNRYIELFKSTPAEVNQVLCSFKNPQQAENGHDNPANAPGLLPFTPLSLLQPPNFSKMFIRVRGMPVDASVADILNFLEGHSQNIVFQGVHLVYNHIGQPAGEAIIQMSSELAAHMACEAKNRKLFYLPTGKRSQVEVSQCAPHEVPTNLGLGPGALGSPPSAATAAAAAAAAAMQQQMQQTASQPGLFHRPLLSPAMSAGTLLPVSQPHHPATGFTHPQPMFHSPQAPPPPPPLPLIPVSRPGAIQFPHVTLPSPISAPSLLANTLMAYPYAPSPQQQPPMQPGSFMYQPGMLNTMNTIIAKGLPKDIDFHEILRLFESIFASNPQTIPDIKIAIGPDGLPSGEAFVSFSSRHEAERAVNECNRQQVRQHCVELMMAQPVMAV